MHTYEKQKTILNEKTPTVKSMCDGWNCAGIFFSLLGQSTILPLYLTIQISSLIFHPQITSSSVKKAFDSQQNNVFCLRRFFQFRQNLLALGARRLNIANHVESTCRKVVKISKGTPSNMTCRLGWALYDMRRIVYLLVSHLLPHSRWPWSFGWYPSGQLASPQYPWKPERQ